MDVYVILIISEIRTVQLHLFGIKKYVVCTETLVTPTLMVAGFNILLDSECLVAQHYAKWN